MKNTIYLTLLGCLFIMSGFAQIKPDWENPEVFAINKEAPRATSMPYPNNELAAKNDPRYSPYYRSLNGNWQFFWAPKIADIPKDFYLDKNFTNEHLSPWKKGTANNITGSKGWTTMPVPGNWEFNGFGIPMYVNTGFGFRARPPFIDRNNSPTGAYRRNFVLPANWKGRKVFLHFEGGTNSMYVWINGRKVGYTENSKSPAEFDVSPYLKPGVNALACEVHKFSDGSYLEDQDMWRLGGINRNVYLYSTAQTRIWDFFSNADLDEEYRNGLFSVDVKVKNYSTTKTTRSVEVAIIDKTGKQIFRQQKNFSVAPKNVDSLQFKGVIPTPQQWTAETPNLYNMVITLKDDHNHVIESTSHRIGFRKVEIRDGQLFVNNKRILIKGVNLHEFNTNTGQVVDSAVMLRNIQLFKELNINAVRTSHYPQQPLWYKLCDEYGIYLVDETNLESHGLGYGPDNVSNFPEWQAAHLDRIQRLIERDKNHASVIIWSLGNEASNGKAFFKMYDWAKFRDKTRPVQYEQAYQRDRNTDIICHMYPSWESMVRDAAKDLKRPYIMCEYAHAMGNSMGNFQEYWDLIRTSKNMQGGFIWEWYNHGFKTKDEQGREYWAYGGDLNGYNNMNDGNFCMDGIISPDQKYLPHTSIVKKVYQNILFKAQDLEHGVIRVSNDFKFLPITPVSNTFQWVLLKNGQQIGTGRFDVSILPDSYKDVKLDLPKLTTIAGDEYYLQVFAYTNIATPFLPANFECAKEEFSLNGNGYFDSKNEKEVAPGSIVKKDIQEKVTLTANGITYEFFKNGRALGSITGRGNGILAKLPKLNFWRAPTDNDYGEQAQYNYRVWEAASLTQNTIFKNLSENDHGYTLNYEVRPVGVEVVIELSYLVKRDGALTINAALKHSGDDLPEMMRFGMNVELPQAYRHLTWYGRGPGENYIDRNKDAFMGIWNGKVEDQAFAYYRPQETGNKTDVRWLTLFDENGHGISVNGAQPLSVSATSNRIEDLDAGTTKKQQHASDILPSDRVILNIDLFQRGIGGLNSWGAKPLDIYRFLAKEYRYSYTLTFIN